MMLVPDSDEIIVSFLEAFNINVGDVLITLQGDYILYIGNRKYIILYSEYKKAIFRIRFFLYKEDIGDCRKINE